MDKLIHFLIILNILCGTGTVLASKNDCVSRDFGNGGTVCVCDENHCDTIDPLETLEAGKFVIYTSNKDGLRFSKTVGNFNTDQNTRKEYELKIDTSKQYQTIYGFGGAFTDSFGINVKSLNPKVQDHLMQSYFSKGGIEYSLCRVPIGGTDFSTRPYTYDDVKGDTTLEKFNLTSEDYDYKIPLIQQALSLRKGEINFFASPWSAPAWAKTNNALAGMGMLYKKYYQYWAEYYLKFLEHYEQNNINFWGITTGNEPINGLLPFIKINSMGWTPATQSQWIRQNLGPTIRNSKFKDIKIIAGDDQRFFLPWFPRMLMKNKETKNYVDGIGVHWYWDNLIPVSAVKATHDSFPEKFILATEACVGDKFYQKSVELGSWRRGEMYAEDIIEDVNNFVTGWIDWNMALNEKGGPTYIDNFVDSPIIVNSTGQEFYKNPMFYVLGHFSKFVPAQSKRIHFEVNERNIKVTAFERPDKGVVVIIFNGHSKDVRLTIIDSKRGAVESTFSKNSINSFIYW